MGRLQRDGCLPGWCRAELPALLRLPVRLSVHCSILCGPRPCPRDAAGGYQGRCRGVPGTLPPYPHHDGEDSRGESWPWGWGKDPGAAWGQGDGGISSVTAHRQSWRQQSPCPPWDLLPSGVASLLRASVSPPAGQCFAPVLLSPCTRVLPGPACSLAHSRSSAIFNRCGRSTGPRSRGGRWGAAPQGGERGWGARHCRRRGGGGRGG